MAETEDTPTPDDEAESTATAEAEGGNGEAGEQQPIKLHQTVEVNDVGPCKKHVKVTVDRTDIDARLDEKYSELVTGHRSYVQGFRPGKAPRKLVERFYREEIENQVRGEVLMASLEQLADEQDIAPLAPPDLDPGKIVIPKEGPLVYEFEVEVRPQFELPNYKGLKLKRPVQQFTDDDVQKEKRRLLEPYGQVVPKEGEPPKVEVGDIITCDIVTRLGDQTLNEVKEVRIRVDPRLALKDGVAENFGKAMAGAEPGDTKTVDIKLSDAVANPALKGQTIQATFTIHDVKTVRLPEITPELLDQFNVSTEEQLDELLRVVLQRRLEYLQRQSARQQVINLVAEKALAQLPQDLLIRQARRALQRKAVEMQSAGLSDEEINGRLRMMQQDVVQSTSAALKEHFVLQKIAEDEKIEVNDDDIDAEIDRIAARTDESPRKVRARLEREDMLEALAAELLESKALDLILDSAEYEDVPLTPSEDEAPVATTEAQAVPGEVKDPTAVAEADEADGEKDEKSESGGEAE
jgi:trigger factor